MDIDPDLRAEIAPAGTLRAGINLSNFLLVSGQTADGDPVGVAPDIARAIAEALGVPLAFRTYPRPGALADDADSNAWDVGLIGAEPQRAKSIAFSPPYCEIAATYLVPPGSPLTAIDQVDQPGIRIAAADRAAYTLWLERNLRHAELVYADGIDASFQRFTTDRLDALAGLYPRLLADAERLPGARILPANFTAVQQSIGVPRERTRAATWLRHFVADALASGLVARLIEKHAATGLSVAPPPDEQPTRP